MEEMVTQGSVQSALTCIEESYFVGDVIIASSAVIGSGVVLRADPGCSITIRDGVCLGPGVIIHATQGAIELHQGACLAGGVLVIGQGALGRQVCIGSGATLINPDVPDASLIGADCLWGDQSRRVTEAVAQAPQESDFVDEEPLQTEPPPEVTHETTEDQETGLHQEVKEISVEASRVTSKTVIGKQQFESMLQKMFPEREAFKRSQSHSE